METFLQAFLGPESPALILAFCSFTILGLLWIKVARYQKNKKARLIQIPPIDVKFNFGKWLNENGLDFLLAFSASFAVFRFFPDAFNFIGKFTELPEFTDKMAYGLFLGIIFQYAFHKWF